LKRNVSVFEHKRDYSISFHSFNKRFKSLFYLDTLDLFRSTYLFIIHPNSTLLALVPSPCSDQNPERKGSPSLCSAKDSKKFSIT
jgi:hypothetical protein